VDEVREDRLVLVPSVPLGADLAGASRAAAVIEWVSRRGRVVLPATVVGEEPRERVRALVVEPAGEPDVIQRRGHVRAVSALPLEVDAGRQTLQGVVEDVSGGGVRARIDGRPLAHGEAVRIRIPLDFETVEANARVAEVYGGGRYGLEFGAIDDADRERLIRHVFERLRIAARRRGP
jgi:c-di-GMP-binding flagellar brake protein YcgR